MKITSISFLVVMRWDLSSLFNNDTSELDAGVVMMKLNNF